jgi:hypothetical protein
MELLKLKKNTVKKNEMDRFWESNIQPSGGGCAYQFVIITTQCICLSDHPVVHLKCAQSLSIKYPKIWG